MRTKLLLYAMLILLVLPTRAQIPIFDRSTDEIAAEMFAFVPDAPQVRESFVSYINYAALEATGPYGEIVPENVQAFNALDDFEQRLWMHRSLRWQAGPPDVFQALITTLRDETETPVNGFDFFAISEAVAFGNPPTQGQVIAADYDLQTFADAQVALDYEQTTFGRLEAWCPVNGCDAGIDIDLRNAERSNLFDSSGLGRKPPILVTEDYLASAFDVDVARAMANAYDGEGRSIMDVRDYRTVFAAVTDAERYSGDLMQVIFLPVEPQPIGMTMLSTVTSPGESPQIPETWATYGDLPPYLMVAIADRQEGDEQVAMLALLYDNRANAEAAAVELENRLAHFSGEVLRRDPDAPSFFDDVPGAVLESHVFEQDDLYVAVAQIRHELPPETPEMIEVRLNDDVDYEGPRFQGYFIRQWMQSIYARAFDVIWNTTTE